MTKYAFKNPRPVYNEASGRMLRLTLAIADDGRTLLENPGWLVLRLQNGPAAGKLVLRPPMVRSAFNRMIPSVKANPIWLKEAMAIIEAAAPAECKRIGKAPKVNKAEELLKDTPTVFGADMPTLESEQFLQYMNGDD